MAKKDTRVIIAFGCQVCKNKNYTVYKSKEIKEKLEVKKFCPNCRKHTAHKETKLK